MSDFASNIEHDLKLLKAGLAEGDDNVIDRQVRILDETFLTSQAYLSIGDEQLLGEAVRLLEQCYGEETAYLLDGLRRHRSMMRVAHANLYAILNAKLSSESAPRAPARLE